MISNGTITNKCLVSIMEEMWSADSELSFQRLKYQAEQRFGRNYFKKNRMKPKKNFAKAI
jgi:hypothetical protein